MGLAHTPAWMQRPCAETATVLALNSAWPGAGRIRRQGIDLFPLFRLVDQFVQGGVDGLFARAADPLVADNTIVIDDVQGRCA
jgi:hypothetical protein